MSGYLDSYGVADAFREKKRKRIVLISVAAVAALAAAYFFLHDFREKRQITRFFSLLESKQYQDAYRMWGCDPAKPCRDYNFEKFMSDWGPSGAHPDAAPAHVRRSRSCDGGVIEIVDFPRGEEVLLYVDRQKFEISYAPFAYCVDVSGHNTKFIDIFFR